METIVKTVESKLIQLQEDIAALTALRDYAFSEDAPEEFRDFYTKRGLDENIVSVRSTLRNLNDDLSALVDSTAISVGILSNTLVK